MSAILPTPTTPCIGEWIENREIDGHKLEARYLFYARGELLLVIPFAIQHGSYTISGTALHFKIPGLDKPEVKFKVAGNLLTLSDPANAQESQFARYFRNRTTPASLRHSSVPERIPGE